MLSDSRKCLFVFRNVVDLRVRSFRAKLRVIVFPSLLSRKLSKMFSLWTFSHHYKSIFGISWRNFPLKNVQRIFEKNKKLLRRNIVMKRRIFFSSSSRNRWDKLSVSLTTRFRWRDSHGASVNNNEASDKRVRRVHWQVLESYNKMNWHVNIIKFAYLWQHFSRRLL